MWFIARRAAAASALPPTDDPVLAIGPIRVDQARHEVLGVQVRTLADHDRLGVFDLGAEPLQKCADRSNDQEGCGLCAGVPLGRGAGR